ncbi:MAG: hypothetical protein H8D56_22940 [Planctomycetes bacterium]|nr:hypothetical protein [Planctomycetota bacterium]MBL7142726.1 hypothetical protein [Phycisphaerae bacterium]
MLSFKMNENLIEQFHQKALQVYEEGKLKTGCRGTPPKNKDITICSRK